MLYKILVIVIQAVICTVKYMILFGLIIDWFINAEPKQLGLLNLNFSTLTDILR